MSLHNYADDNTLLAYSSDLNSLIDVLIEESQITINKLKENYVMLNPKKISNNVCIKDKKTVPEDLNICTDHVNTKPHN